MSNITPNIIDPGKGRPPMPPDSLPQEDLPDDDHVGPDDVREPADDLTLIEPDPEERPNRPDDIERARQRTMTGR